MHFTFKKNNGGNNQRSLNMPVGYNMIVSEWKDMDYCPYCAGMIQNNVCSRCNIIFVYDQSTRVCRYCNQKDMIKPSLHEEFLHQCEFCAYYYYVGPIEGIKNDAIEKLRAIEMQCDECHGKALFIERESAYICQECGLVLEVPLERLLQSTF